MTNEYSHVFNLPRQRQEVGIPERMEIVRKLGMDIAPREIAKAHNVEVKAVYSISREAKRVGLNLASVPRSGTFAKADPDTLCALRVAAGRRKWSTEYLIQEILAVLVKDNLLDAVLDDGFTNSTKP